jgi:tetratricopeptide (TPR) repeat protein
VGYWLVLSLGAVTGAVAPWLTSGEMTLSGVGLSVGLISALALFVTVQSLIDSFAAKPEVGGPVTLWDGLVLALLATFVAHMAEIQVGIAITATRLYFWFYAATIILAARGLLAREAPVPSSAAGPVSGGKKPKSKHRKAKAMLAASVGDARRNALVYSLIVGSLCCPFIFGMTLSNRSARTLGAIVANSWFGSDGVPTIAQLSALSWLVIATLLVAYVLASTEIAGKPGRAQVELWAMAGPALVLITAFALNQAGRVASAIEQTGAADEILVDAEFVANHFGVLVAGLVGVCVVIALLLASMSGERRPLARGRMWLGAASALLIVSGAIVVVNRYNIDPVRADSLLRVANHLIKTERTEIALELLDRAVALSPSEPMHQLVRGSAALTAAVKAGDVDRRAAFFERSESSLRRALELAPLDPDHSANLARCLARQASVEKDRRRKTELMQSASEHYAAAVRLRPRSVIFLNESGRLLLNMGRSDEARRRLERAVEIDRTFAEPHIALAALAERSALSARSRGDATESLRFLEQAAAFYERALELKPELEPVRRNLERVRRAIALQKARSQPPTSE